MKSPKYLEIAQLLAKGDEAAAIAAIKVAQELSEAERLELEGNAYFHSGALQKAINIYEELFAKYPSAQPARYYYVVGVKMERANESGKAFGYYRSAIEAEPTFVDPYIELGGLLYKAKDYEGAVKCFERALEFDPKDLRIYENLRTLYGILVNVKPEIYQERKRLLDASYEQLKEELGPIPKGHRW